MPIESPSLSDTHSHSVESTLPAFLKVVILVDDTRPGPIVDYVAALVRHVQRWQVRPLVLTIARHDDGTEEIQHEDVSVISLERRHREEMGCVGRVWDDLLAVFGLRTILEKVRPDVLHAIGPRSDLVGRAASAMSGSRPFVTTHVEGAEDRGLTQLVRAWTRFAFPSRLRFFEDADLLRAAATLGAVRRDDPCDRIVGPAIDVEVLRCEPPASEDDLPADRIYVGYAASRGTTDATRDMLDAFEILSAGRDDIHLVIPFTRKEAKLEPWVTDKKLADKIRYVEGHAAWGRALRRLAVVWVHGAPAPRQRSILEAMAMGVPVVCDHVTGLAPEIREIGGALMRDAAWPRQFAEATREILSNADLALALGRAGRLVVQQRFPFAKHARNIRKAWAEVSSEAWEPIESTEPGRDSPGLAV